jgi:hypothetical protein
MTDGDWLMQEFQEAERFYRALPEGARPVVVPAVNTAEPALDPESSKWQARAEKLLEQALDEVRDDHDAAIGTAEAALLALRAWLGELPKDEAAELAAELDELWREPVCICPPDLVARGGHRGGCPVHSFVFRV